LRILFITHTRIGDAVMSAGLLHHLVQRYPDARFTIACGPLAAPLFAAVPRLDRLIVVKKQRFDVHWYKLWKQVRGIVWDKVIDLRRSLISYLVPVHARHIVAPIAEGVHHVAHLATVLNLPAPAAPFLYITQQHRKAAAGLIPDGSKVLALAPVAATAAKTWAPERFAELAGRLLAEGGLCAGWRLALVGGPGDARKAAALVEAYPQALCIFDEPDLLTVHAALARCGAFIGNDSGLAHLAAAGGVPTLALFGPTDPRRYGPWGGAVVKAATIPDLGVAQVLQAMGRVLAPI